MYKKIKLLYVAMDISTMYGDQQWGIQQRVDLEQARTHPTYTPCLPKCLVCPLT